MKITKEKILAHADDVEHVLELIGDVVGGKLGGIAIDAARALSVVEVAYKVLSESLHGGEVDIPARTRIAALRAQLAKNDADVDAAIAKKFDTGGE